MEDFHAHKILTLNAYEACAEKFAKNTESLHPQDQARHFLESLPGKRILDLGCGPGRDALIFARQGFQVTGVDLSPKMIEMAKSKVAAQFHVMDIENLDFPPCHFDGIWASASLLHVPKGKILTVFKNLYSLLVDRGIFYFSVKKGSGEKLLSDPRYGDVQKFWSFFEKEEIEEFVQQAGFNLISSVVAERKSTYQGHLLWLNVICKKERA